MRKFNTIEKTSGWSTIYKETMDLFGKEEADQIFEEAIHLTDQFQKKYLDCSGIKKMHVQSAIAVGSIYLPLKDKIGEEKAVKLIEEAEKPTAIAKHNKIEKFPPKMFMKVAETITSTMFSEKAGFQRKTYANTSKEKRFDLLTCPYVDVLKDMGCVEVCKAICIQDDYSFSNMKNGVLFEREKTLGRGDDCCDFCYRIPEK